MRVFACTFCIRLTASAVTFEPCGHKRHVPSVPLFWDAGGLPPRQTLPRPPCHAGRHNRCQPRGAVVGSARTRPVAVPLARTGADALGGRRVTHGDRRLVLLPRRRGTEAAVHASQCATGLRRDVRGDCPRRVLCGAGRVGFAEWQHRRCRDHCRRRPSHILPRDDSGARIRDPRIWRRPCGAGSPAAGLLQLPSRARLLRPGLHSRGDEPIARPEPGADQVVDARWTRSHDSFVLLRFFHLFLVLVQVSFVLVQDSAPDCFSHALRCSCVQDSWSTCPRGASRCSAAARGSTFTTPCRASWSRPRLRSTPLSGGWECGRRPCFRPTSHAESLELNQRAHQRSLDSSAHRRRGAVDVRQLRHKRRQHRRRKRHGVLGAHRHLRGGTDLTAPARRDRPRRLDNNPWLQFRAYLHLHLRTCDCYCISTSTCIQPCPHSPASMLFPACAHSHSHDKSAVQHMGALRGIHTLMPVSPTAARAGAPRGLSGPPPGGTASGTPGGRVRRRVWTCVWNFPPLLPPGGPGRVGAGV